jgi:hypothetical protein
MTRVMHDDNGGSDRKEDGTRPARPWAAQQYLGVNGAQRRETRNADFQLHLISSFPHASQQLQKSSVYVQRFKPAHSKPNQKSPQSNQEKLLVAATFAGRKGNPHLGFLSCHVEIYNLRSELSMDHDRQHLPVRLSRPDQLGQ